MYVWAAIGIGLLGSAHCAGMCAPVIMAVQRGKSHWSKDALHHGGRIFTYMVFGALAGAIGSSFSWMGYQQAFSITLGVLMILGVIAWPLAKRFRQLEGVIGRWSIRFTGWIHSLGLAPWSLRLLGGVANGILPCGLVYLAVAGAASTFTPWDGALFMMLFGFGTLPVLVGVTRLGHLLSAKMRSRFRKLIPLTMFVAGMLLVARGANLGVPYLSPEAPEAGEVAADCR